MSDRIIIIPSRGRPTVPTMSLIPKSYKPITYIAVRPDEEKMYRKNYDNLVVIPKTITNLSQKRQWLVEKFDARYHIQLDDDFTGFFYKPDQEVFGGLERMDKSQTKEMFDDVFDRLTRIPHVGICDRTRSARAMTMISRNTMIMQFLAYDTRAIKKSGAKFDDVILAQDKHMCLSLLEHGFKNIVLNYYSFTCMAYESPGGCSAYRTKELRHQQCEHFCSLHKFAKVEQKTYQKQGTISRLRIQWKKSFGIKKP